MTEHVFHLPDLGEGLVEGEIIEWLVRVGDEVAVDRPVVVVETVKTTVELPIPYSGRVIALHGEVAGMIAVGAPLVTVLADDSEPAAGTHHLVGQRPAASTAGGTPPALPRLPPKPASARTVASPAIRRLARDLGVELRTVRGTGEGGAVTRDDVLAAGRRSAGEVDG